MTPEPSSSLLVNIELPRKGFRLQVDLVLPGQGITVLYGVSGSGKTSLLRCVAGLERPERAKIVIGNEVWQDSDQRLFVPTHKRLLGYVFQEASLFEHLNVRDNLQFGLKRRHTPQSSSLLDTAISLLGIGHLLHRQPAGLSGGERQRVAIARALASGPRILLLDEPMSALDQARREEVMPWLEKLRDQLKLPMLYVTHSANELQRLADHVVALEQGTVVASGPIHDILGNAEHPIIAGDDAGSVLIGRVSGLHSEWQMARITLGPADFWVSQNNLAIGQDVRLLVMARDVSITQEKPEHTSIQNHLPCQVVSVSPDTHPSQLRVQLRCDNITLSARITQRAQAMLHLQPGQSVWAQVKSVALVK